MGAKCDLCGEPMPEHEQMFKFHGYSGPCPAPPKPRMRTVVEYSTRGGDDGHWIDIRADGVQREPIGPFASASDCKNAYDDLLSMMRATGAVDMPTHKQ